MEINVNVYNEIVKTESDNGAHGHSCKWNIMQINQKGGKFLEHPVANIKIITAIKTKIKGFISKH